MLLRCNLFTSLRFADGNGPARRSVMKVSFWHLTRGFDPKPPTHHDQSERDPYHERGEGRHAWGDRIGMPSSTSASLPPGASAMPSPINTPALKFSSQENCGRQSTRKVPRWSVDNSIPAMTRAGGPCARGWPDLVPALLNDEIERRGITDRAVEQEQQRAGQADHDRCR